VLNIQKHPPYYQQNSSLVRILIPQSSASNAVNLFLETPEKAIESQRHLSVLSNSQERTISLGDTGDTSFCLLFLEGKKTTTFKKNS